MLKKILLFGGVPLALAALLAVGLYWSGGHVSFPGGITPSGRDNDPYLLTWIWPAPAQEIAAELCAVKSPVVAVNYGGDLYACGDITPEVLVPAPGTSDSLPISSCFGAIDGTTVAYGAKVEFDPAIVATIHGPAVMEWWNGATPAPENEGMFYVPAGQTVTLPLGMRGGQWPVVKDDQGALATLVASHLHLRNFADKPQHAYAAQALAKALGADCDWAPLTTLMVKLPSGSVTK